MKNRNAVSTIKGYFYQFDLTIRTILEQEDQNSVVLVEGIEDIDINNSIGTETIQCKYHSETTYNHSVIAKPIRLMFEHYVSLLKNNDCLIKYNLYCFFSTGIEKLNLPITLEFLKNKLLTYTKNHTKIVLYENLRISDEQLNIFLNLLTIKILKDDLNCQYTKIICCLKKIFNCNTFEAEYYYYNNALKLIKEISTNKDEDRRKISKRDFLQKINKKQILLNSWLLQARGETEYLKKIKIGLFSDFNLDYIERFFIIEVEDNYQLSDVKELIYVIVNRFTNIRKKEPQPFCPYILFINLQEDDLIKIKNTLYNEECIFIDGYPFKGSLFKPNYILQQATFLNQLHLKIIDSLPNLEELIKINKKRQNFFIFYINNLIKLQNVDINKEIQIQIKNINYVRRILK